VVEQEKYSRIREIVDGLSDEEKKSMTHEKACQIIACEPSVMTLAKIVDEHPEVDFKTTKEVVQEINKRLYKRNKFLAPSKMIGAALYLANKNLNQERASELAGITEVSLRSVLKISKFDRKDKAKYAHKIAMDKYDKWQEKWQREITEREGKIINDQKKAWEDFFNK
jgi:hypothetical protein